MFKQFFYSAVILLILASAPVSVSAQQQSFDLIQYTPPAGWKKEASPNAVQLSREDSKAGSYCAITIFKSIESSGSSKDNFDAAWETVVKEIVKTNGAPEMQPPAKENGWEALSGYAQFESEGQKGLALLVTSSGFNRMVNILVLTNTSAYENDLSAFIE